MWYDACIPFTFTQHDLNQPFLNIALIKKITQYHIHVKVFMPSLDYCLLVVPSVLFHLYLGKHFRLLSNHVLYSSFLSPLSNHFLTILHNVYLPLLVKMIQYLFVLNVAH